MKHLIAVIGLVLLYISVDAQVIGVEEFRQFNSPSDDSTSHSSWTAFQIPSLSPEVIVVPKTNYQNKSSWFNRKLFREDFAVIEDKENYRITINPILDLRYGRESDSTTYQNTRGFILNGRFAKNLLVRSEFYENQAVLPAYAAAWADTMKVIPGMIHAKPFGSNGFDYGVVFSQIMWQPFKNYGLRLGFDRLHIGKGYRSMVLSDASQAYPFLMNTFTHDKWSLSHSIASLRNPDFNNKLGIPRAETGAFQQKWFSFTYLTFRPNEWLNLGLYESIVFMPSDSTGIAFYPLSMLPVPLVRTGLEESKGLHHVLVALLADATIKKQFTVYSQMVIDELNSSGQSIQGAAQLGFRWVKNSQKDSKVAAFTEFNLATDNAYTSSDAWTAYTNHDQPLAHPSGQQFMEWVSGFHFSNAHWLADLKYNTIWGCGLPVTDSYFGRDSYAGSGFYAPQSQPDKVSHFQMTLGYQVNKTTNLIAFAGIHYRNYKNAYSDIPTNSLLFEVGLRHVIRRQYYDFF